MRRIALGLCIISLLLGGYLFTVFFQQQYGISPINELKKHYRKDPPPLPQKKKDITTPRKEVNRSELDFEDVDISEKGSVMLALSEILEVDSIRIDRGWTGYSRIGRTQSHYFLQRSASAFRGEVSFYVGFNGENRKDARIKIPINVTKRFLKKLSDTPVIERSYKPRITVTDSYPSTTIELETKNESVVFWTKSQGEGNVPWGVRFGAKEYVANSDYPALALKELEPYLKREELSKLIKEVELLDRKR